METARDEAKAGKQAGRGNIVQKKPPVHPEVFFG